MGEKNMLAKPKSAPARQTKMRFKWFSSKTNSLKEIDAWANGGDYRSPPLSHSTARVTGQLTDNVTEERMLQAKIRELSKERYKFIAQKDYDKKLFLEKQQCVFSKINVKLLSGNYFLNSFSFRSFSNLSISYFI